MVFEINVIFNYGLISILGAKQYNQLAFTWNVQGTQRQ